MQGLSSLGKWGTISILNCPVCQLQMLSNIQHNAKHESRAKRQMTRPLTAREKLIAWDDFIIENDNSLQNAFLSGVVSSEHRSIIPCYQPTEHRRAEDERGNDYQENI